MTLTISCAVRRRKLFSFCETAANTCDVNRQAVGAAMEVSWISLVGAVAGMSTTGAFLPQVVRAWRTRSTHDISLSMFLLTVFGLLLWFIYGLVLNDWPLIITDAVSLILAGTVVGLKLRYG